VRQQASGPGVGPRRPGGPARVHTYPFSHPWDRPPIVTPGRVAGPRRLPSRDRGLRAATGRVRVGGGRSGARPRWRPSAGCPSFGGMSRAPDARATARRMAIADHCYRERGRRGGRWRVGVRWGHSARRRSRGTIAPSRRREGRRGRPDREPSCRASRRSGRCSWRRRPRSRPPSTRIFPPPTAATILPAETAAVSPPPTVSPAERIGETLATPRQPRAPATPDPEAAPSAAPSPLPSSPADAPAARATVGVDQGLNVRDLPGLGSTVITVLPVRAVVEIVGESRIVDGYTWVQIVTAASERGWAAAAFLLPDIAPAPAPGE